MQSFSTVISDLHKVLHVCCIYMLLSQKSCERAENWGDEQDGLGQGGLGVIVESINRPSDEK